MKRLLALSVLAMVCLASMRADATDRFFSDIDSYSPSKRYRVTAKSPDNQKRKGRVAFQSSFVYKCTDTRHLIMELMTGTIKAPTKRLTEATQKAERKYVLSVLKTVIDGTAKKCDCCGGYHEAVYAAYLAGVLKIQEAVPALRNMENSTHNGSSTMGGFGEAPEGRIDPFNYATYTTRQNVHVALRRLGEKPGAYPCTSFKTEHKEYRKQKAYVRKPVPGTRASNAEKVKKGMSPEQVIDLIDCPDYIPTRKWRWTVSG